MGLNASSDVCFILKCEPQKGETTNFSSGNLNQCVWPVKLPVGVSETIKTVPSSNKTGREFGLALSGFLSGKRSRWCFSLSQSNFFRHQIAAVVLQQNPTPSSPGLRLSSTNENIWRFFLACHYRSITDCLQFLAHFDGFYPISMSSWVLGPFFQFSLIIIIGWGILQH